MIQEHKTLVGSWCILDTNLNFDQLSKFLDNNLNILFNPIFNRWNSGFIKIDKHYYSFITKNENGENYETLIRIGDYKIATTQLSSLQIIERTINLFCFI